MKIQTIAQAMSRTQYPGRGIVAGKSADGGKAIFLYFIMGRSVNSRNRVFVEKDGGIVTRAHDESLMRDPSLIIYAPVRVLNNHVIVTNGDQTDTIYDHLSSGGTFESALRERAFEPDAPNFTARISALATFDSGDFFLRMAILKAADSEGVNCNRFFYEYESPRAGMGYFLHTYAEDGDPLPAFEGEPEQVQLSGSLEEIARDAWENLNRDNRVSLWARAIDLTTGEIESLIINSNAQGEENVTGD